jgi:hypothetical protein
MFLVLFLVVDDSDAIRPTHIIRTEALGDEQLDDSIVDTLVLATLLMRVATFLHYRLTPQRLTDGAENSTDLSCVRAGVGDRNNGGGYPPKANEGDL